MSMDTGILENLLPIAHQQGILQPRANNPCFVTVINNANQLLMIVQQAEEKGLPTKEVAQKMGWGLNTTRVYLRNLLGLGLLNSIRIGQRDAIWGLAGVLNPEILYATEVVVETETEVDSKIIFDLGYEFARGRIENSRALLLQVYRKKEIKIECVELALKEIGQALKQLRFVKNQTSLMGMMGRALQHYFVAICEFVNKKDFVGSNKEQSNFNTIRNYIQKLLISECRKALLGAGLKELKKRKILHRSLEQDLANEFFPMLVDAIALKAINLQCLSMGDFAYAGQMSRRAQTNLNKLFEAKLEKRIIFPSAYLEGKSTKYGKCIEIQAETIVRILSGEDIVYRHLSKK